MHAARVILDFPGPGRNSERLVFGAPRRVIAADAIGVVPAALREAEAAARSGAWVAGFIAYEAAPAFDAALATLPHRGPAPLLWFGVFDPPSATRSPVSAECVPPLEWSADVTRGEYDAAIDRIRSAIADGDVYQVNHTLRFNAPCSIAPALIYDALVAARHGVYHAFIETPAWAIVSASPELFVDVRDRTIITRPMKGTLPRGRWPEEDRAAAARLARSPKDRAENLMIVDLLRNDLGRIACFGSVTVPEMFAIETFPTVHQMTSTITAELRADVGLADVFAATFPCGSVTGAPKIAAMQQIAALEHSPRGAYCGAIGLIRPDGTATFSVAIRTLLLDRAANTAVYGAGGGITWDSRAEAEYAEALAKAAMLTERIPDFALIETMRLENGHIRRLELHRARLTASAQYWGFAAHGAPAAAAALDRARADTPHGAWRLRLTLDRDGSVRITRTPLDDSPGSLTQTGVADHSAAPARIIALANLPIDSRDRLLHHKTTTRDAFDALRAHHPDAFDVLLRNEHDCITEFTTGNVVCEIDGALLTPPRDHGLLAGTFRQQLLAGNSIREHPIHVHDLPRVSRMWLINSVREWVAVILTTRSRTRPRDPAVSDTMKGQSR